ncbi:tRNA-uridine aminocarboxypropyltransferase [uncultured Paraglaciecola sp.]|uniref:tRNA-uridine aminocarboxypropyltransferase n=1 Tax=uncultured Paraglaciecola sp. TaxID=1765024 RepID=UPI00262CB964|nr:tRNA-uridine aminocarboxypropyltransferase [uncultured Paraglaciecola sp.]
MHINAVHILRQQQLALSTKEFRARGYKVKRCDRCLIPVAKCICALRPSTVSRSAFCIVMYKNEYYKPSNTGKLIADVIPDNYAFRWDRVAPDPALISLLNNPKYQPIVVFPQQYADAHRCIDSPQDLSSIQQGKIPLFVMLDGTWREASKMFKSPSFSHLPVLGIQPEAASVYQLREAAHAHQLCTAEVAIEILKLAADEQAAEALQVYFQHFKGAYIAGKAHLTLI